MKFLRSVVRSSPYLVLSKQSFPSLTTQSWLSTVGSEVFSRAPWQFKTPVNFGRAFSIQIVVRSLSYTIISIGGE